MENHRKDNGQIYQFHLKGQLDERWLSCFSGFSLNNTDLEDCVLSGVVTDQACLYEIIHKIRDIGIPIIAIERLDIDKL